MSGTNFPGAIDDSTSLPPPSPNTITNIGVTTHAVLHGNEIAAIEAIEAKLGTGASTPTANKVLRATGTGTTAYAQVGLTTDVTGVLPVANGGAGTISGILRANGSGTVSAATAGTDYAGISTAQTLTATILQSRTLSTSTSPVTPTASSYDLIILALTGSMTIASPGTGLEGQRMIFRIKDNGTPQTITWNAIFRAVGTVLPVVTIANKTFYIGVEYNAVDSTWDAIAVVQQA